MIGDWRLALKKKEVILGFNWTHFGDFGGRSKKPLWAKTKQKKKSLIIERLK